MARESTTSAKMLNKLAHHALKDPDGHKMMYIHDFNFGRGWMPFLHLRDFFALKGAVLSVLNI